MLPELLAGNRQRSLTKMSPSPPPPSSQTLEPSEEDQLLILKDEEDPQVLAESCPQEFLNLQEKDVSC